MHWLHQSGVLLFPAATPGVQQQLSLPTLLAMQSEASPSSVEFTAGASRTDTAGATLAIITEAAPAAANAAATAAAPSDFLMLQMVLPEGTTVLSGTVLYNQQPSAEMLLAMGKSGRNCLSSCQCTIGRHSSSCCAIRHRGCQCHISYRCHTRTPAWHWWQRHRSCPGSCQRCCYSCCTVRDSCSSWCCHSQ